MNLTTDPRPTLAQGLPAFCVVCALVAVGPGCASSKGGAGVANPERQSDSEYDLSRDAFYRGRLREALDHAQKSVALDDSNAKALYFTAAIYLGFCSTGGMKSPDCRLADAEDFANRALKADGQFRDARNTLGQIQILEKKYSEAMKTLEPLTKDPAYVANYLAWGNYGWAQVLSGKLDDGITSLRNSITEPRFCTGDYRLGVAYEKKGDLVAAEKSFSDAVQVASADCQNLQDAWFERGRVRMKLGNAGDAQADFARCREISIDTDAGKECAKLAGSAAPTPVQPIAPPPGPPPPSSTPQPQASASGAAGPN